MQTGQNSVKIELKRSYFLEYCLKLSQKSQGSNRGEQIILPSLN